MFFYWLRFNIFTVSVFLDWGPHTGSCVSVSTESAASIIKVD